MATHSQKDLGTIMAVLNRLNNDRMPRALALKDKINAGGVLDAVDNAFIQTALADATSLRALADRNPEYKELVDGMSALYDEITTKGKANAQKAEHQP